MSFQKALSKSAVSGAGDAMVMPADVPAAEAARNHLSKTIYQLLVQWVLKQYKKLRFGEDHSPSCTSKILVVDFFGTESLPTNSFMQFCSNYCSERVHDHFVTTVFAKEQEQYANEGVQWNFIPYTSNKEVVQMYESPENGFLGILEAEAHMPNPSDEKLLQQCYSKIKSVSFKASTKDHKALKFTIRHHVGPVTYDSHGFTEKNQIAQVTGEMKTLFSHSTSDFVTSLAEEMSKEPKQDQRLRFVSASSRTKTTTTLLQRQMDSLTRKASSTKQHWLICLQTGHTVGQFDEAVVLDQIIDRGLVPLVALHQKGKLMRLIFD
jgi:myosin-5